MRRVEARLEDEQHRRLADWCEQQDRQLSWALRKAVAAWLRSPSVLAVGDPDAWRPDGSAPPTRWRCRPEAEVAYLRAAHSSEGGHEIASGGRRLWVLPDGRTSGQRRSRLISQALGAAEKARTCGVDPLHLVYGTLAVQQTGVLLWRGTE